RKLQPHLHAAPDSLVVGSDVGDAEVVFTALPAGEAAKQAGTWLDEGRTVIDIGSDFRLRDPVLYERWYGYTHPAPALLAEAIYGLTELARDRIRGARLIANPGCYPTAALLALAPALKGRLVGDEIIVDGKTGVSGAGNTIDEAYLFGTIDESVRPYGLPKHRHTPEIVQEAAALLGAAPKLTFTPHLVPMTRGLIATCYAPLSRGATAKDIADAYAREYAEEPFIRVTDTYPATKATLGSNWCLVHAVVDEANARLVTRSDPERGAIRRIAVGCGIAKACTGDEGEKEGMAMAEAGAKVVGCSPYEVAIASTGVIEWPLPVNRIAKAFGEIELRENN